MALYHSFSKASNLIFFWACLALSEISAALLAAAACFS
jgi:hypothetical protein